MRKAAFLDRDGVLNRNAAPGEYILRWEELAVLPGVTEAIALLNRAGFVTVIVTNQRCVAKGLISAGDLESLHARLLAELSKSGAVLDAIYYCPHEANACECRKPKPGMLLRAASDLDVDLSASWMIGDSEIDLEAGQRAGCKTVHISGGGKTSARKPDFEAKSLLDAVGKVLEFESSRVS
jgi:D-glycero-D-manno-heptose 1,7-bisphosphate phosphatase